MCDMERDTIDLALRYYCEYRDWGKLTNKNNNMDLLSIFSNIEETDTLYVVIAIGIILLLWGITKLVNKKK